MYGYIVPCTPELKVKDKELYRAYYCGLCRTLKKYGLNSRLTLNYDAAFAAVLLAGITGLKPTVAPRGCALHPMKGKLPTVEPDAVTDYCAAVCVLLAKYKLLDDARDGKPLRKAYLPIIARGIKRAEAKYPEAARVLSDGLSNLSALESGQEFDPDAAPMNFGTILSELFTACPLVKEELKPLLKEVGWNLGGFVYTLDAWDDRANDEKNNTYNIFLRAEFEDPRETCEAMLDMYINSAVLAYDLMDIPVNKPLLDNIMYMGLAAKAASVFKKSDENEKKKEANQ